MTTVIHCMTLPYNTCVQLILAVHECFVILLLPLFAVCQQWLNRAMAATGWQNIHAMASQNNPRVSGSTRGCMSLNTAWMGSAGCPYYAHVSYDLPACARADT